MVKLGGRQKAQRGNFKGRGGEERGRRGGKSCVTAVGGMDAPATSYVALQEIFVQTLSFTFHLHLLTILEQPAMQLLGSERTLPHYENSFHSSSVCAAVQAKIFVAATDTSVHPSCK